MKRPFEGKGLTFIGQLGRGGTAEVAKVFVDRLNCEAALKYPLPDESDPTLDFSELADREYCLIGGNRFPGLVRLLAPPHRNPDYLLLELCGGPTLDQVEIPSDSPLLLNVLCAAALDLEYLHASGIIHGDIKPQNFFLPSDWQSCTGGRLFHLKLSDFSLGRHIAEPADSRAGLGTVGYMPPETIRDGITCHRSDLFALGITAYQLITGHHPFLEEDADPTRVSSRILEEEPTPISSLTAKVPDGLAELVSELLAKDPDSRPESAWSVCQRLREIGAGYPFQKALHPRYFIRPERSFDANIKSALAVDDHEANLIRQLCCGDVRALRLLVTGNFRRGTLRYTDGAYAFHSRILWPKRLRNEVLRRFCELDLTGRKKIVRAAVIGDIDDAVRLGYFSGDETAPSDSALVRLIRALLRTATVKRLSRIPAARAEQSELYGTAANLYLQSGQLTEAERCAYQRCVTLIKDHRYEEALQLSRRVVNYATLREEKFLVRELLMVQGDIHKLTGETARALETYQEIIDLYDSHPVDKLLAETYRDIGDVYKARQEVKLGIEALEHALKIVTELNDDIEISRVLNNLGNLYIFHGDATNALQMYRRAFATQRRHNAVAEAATTLMNIGGVYFTVGRYRRSLRVLELALRMKKDTGDASEIARTLNNLGYVHHVGGDSAKGVQYLEESLEINRRIGSKKEVLFNLANLTEIMIAAGQLKQSLGYLKEGMSLSESLNDKPHLGQFLVSMGYVLLRMGRLNEAASKLDEAKGLIADIDHPSLARTCDLYLANLRLEVGDIASAIVRAREVRSAAESAHDSQNQVVAQILLCRMESDADGYLRTKEVIAQQQLKREEILLEFARLELLLCEERPDEVANKTRGLQHIPLEWGENIELPWMCNLMAEALIGESRYEEAMTYLARSQRLASTSGLKSEMASAFALQGMLSFHDKDYEQCFALYKQALSICKSIVGSIETEPDKKHFMQKRIVVFLSEEIRRLSKLLGQKGRAG